MISTQFMRDNKIDISKIIEFIETDLNEIEHAIIGGLPKNHEICKRETILLCIVDILEKIQENENKASESTRAPFWVCCFCKKNIYELTHTCD